MSRWLLAALLLAGCSTRSDTDFFCERFIQLTDDINAGLVPTEDEFLERIAPEALGDPEGTIGADYDRLLDEIARGDSFAAAETSGVLLDACLSIQ